MGKYNVGDEVRLVSSSERLVMSGILGYSAKMLAGKIVKISGVLSPRVTDIYHIKESCYAFGEELIVGLVPKEYKVGDRVVITSERISGMSCLGGMDKYLGTVMTIANENKYGTFWMEEDNGKWLWSKDMFWCLAPDQNKKSEEKMMKYKVGDKVRIAKNRTNGMNVRGFMDKYLGTVMTIEKIVGDTYKMVEDNGRWVWWDRMIAGPATPERFHPTDCIVLLSDGTVTKAYHKKNGKVIAHSTCKRHEDDPHNLFFAADLCLDRLEAAEEALQAPKHLYSGRVVCTKTSRPWWKVGKIYEIKNGYIVSETGTAHGQCRGGFKSFEEFVDYCKDISRGDTEWVEITE